MEHPAITSTLSQEGGARHTPKPKAAYRSDPPFLRNGYRQECRWDIPVIRKQSVDLSGPVGLIACTDTRPDDEKNAWRGVHHFVDDARFEDAYRHSERRLAKYSQYRFVLTPDYSLFPEMPLWRQIESVGKSHWCGAYWQEHGITVVPTMGWGLAPTFDFCFAGVEDGSVVAVSTLGCRAGRTRFLRGYDTILERVRPEAVICFGKPVPGMRGEIVEVDYLGSRRAVR